MNVRLVRIGEGDKFTLSVPVWKVMAEQNQPGRPRIPVSVSIYPKYGRRAVYTARHRLNPSLNLKAHQRHWCVVPFAGKSAKPTFSIELVKSW